MSDVVLETERLRLRKLNTADAPTICRLLNEPSFLENIGDRGVRTIEDACHYLQSGPMTMYLEHGFGLWMTELRETGEPVGICGLLKRPTLDDVDVGYALFPSYWGRGFASEAVRATMEYANATLGRNRVVAIVSPHNERSKALLRKLGFVYERMHDETELLAFGGA
jgi:RimJ/RimL family protein N-acetyltransferase